ncbi:MAG: sensor histidine kinase, partial [Candidatus Hodarchaeota archaeon]
LLLEKIYGELNETQIDRIHDIKTSASDLLDLINSLLGISKMESGDFSLNCQIFKLNDLLDQIAAIIEPLYSEKNLKFEIKGLMPSMDLCADPLRFKEILYNLLSNAIKYTNKGEITLEISQNKDYWEFKVIDTGIGIESRDLQLIFEEFIRIDSEELENIEGTGLGLTITKKLVELHGGQISVESIPKKGSTFTFTIPKNLKVSEN